MGNMESKTQKGLKFILIGLGVGIILNIVLFFYSFIQTDDFLSGIIGLSIIGIFAIIMGIILLIGAILFLIGKNEFGEKHSKNVTNAAIIYIISIFGVGIISTAVSFASYGITPDNPTSSLYLSSLLPGVLGAIFGGLTYYFALKELEDDRGIMLLYLAFAVSIVVTVITSLVTIGYFGDMLTDISSGTGATSSNPSTIFNGIIRITRVAIFSSISGLLWFMVVYIPYNRIKSGELVPIKNAEPLFGSSNTAPKRICPTCGKGIPFDANICPYCGKKFENYIK